MKKIADLLREIEHLSPQEARVLCLALLQKSGLTFLDPGQLYDDWDDPDVDAAYSEDALPQN